MPDAFGNLTEEERYAKALREGKISPGMINQSVTPAVRALANRDYSGKEAQYAAQLRAGREGLATGAAPGKRFDAGMGVEQYVAPTWSEVANNAAKQVIGGLEMRQARKGMEELQGAQQATADAKGIIQADAAKRAAEQQQFENTLATQGLTQAAEIAAADRDAANARNAATIAGSASRNAAGLDAGWKPETYHDPSGKGVINVVRNGRGEVRLGSMKGRPMSPEEMQGLVPVTPGQAEGSTPIAEAARAESMINKAPRVTSNIGSLVNDPILGSAVGYEPTTLGGTFGVGPQGPEKQALHARIAGINLEPILEKVKNLKPVSDTDIRLLNEPLPGVTTQPLGHVDYHVRNTYQDIRDAYDYAIENAEGPEKEALMAERVVEVDGFAGDLARAAITHDLPVQSLKDAGFPADLVEYVRLKQKEKER